MQCSCGKRKTLKQAATYRSTTNNQFLNIIQLKRKKNRAQRWRMSHKKVKKHFSKVALTLFKNTNKGWKLSIIDTNNSLLIYT